MLTGTFLVEILDVNAGFQKPNSLPVPLDVDHSQCNISKSEYFDPHTE